MYETPRRLELVRSEVRIETEGPGAVRYSLKVTLIETAYVALTSYFKASLKCVIII